jgi:hypothetical protein
MADNSFISKDHRKGLLIGSLLAAGAGLATGGITDALKAGSGAYTGGMEQIYKQRENELQEERVLELIKASQLQSALEQNKFEQEQKEWGVKEPYTRALTGQSNILTQKTEQEMLDDKILREAIGADTTIDPTLKSILSSDSAARKSFIEKKYNLGKETPRWADYMFPSGKYAGSFDLDNPVDRESIKKLGLVPYAAPSQRMSPAEAKQHAKDTMLGQLEGQKEFFSTPGSAGAIERSPKDKLLWEIFQEKFWKPEREK